MIATKPILDFLQKESPYSYSQNLKLVSGVLFGLCLLLISGGVQAQDVDNWESLNSKGFEAYKAKEFIKAAKIYERTSTMGTKFLMN